MESEYVCIHYRLQTKFGARIFFILVKSKEGLWAFIHGKSCFSWPAESPGYHQWQQESQ